MKAVVVTMGLGQGGASMVHGHDGADWCGSKQPYLDTAIEAFARAGFDEVAVVLGQNADLLRHYLYDSARYGIAVYCVENLQYQRGDATALLAARAFVGGEPFVMCMAMEPPWPEVLLQLLGRPRLRHTVCVANRRNGQARCEATIRVQLDRREQVFDMGPDLARWQAVATGTYLFRPDVFDAAATVMQWSGGRPGVHQLVRQLVSQGEVVEACRLTATAPSPSAWATHPQLFRQALLSVRVGQEHLTA